jgi:hypothetical protein
MRHIELRIWTYIIWIVNKIEPNLINLNWAIRVLHELNIRAKFIATHGNLMNLIEPITSSKLDLSLPHGS